MFPRRHLHLALTCGAAIACACDPSDSRTRGKDPVTVDPSPGGTDGPPAPTTAAPTVDDPVVDPVAPTAKLVLPAVEPIPDRWWEAPEKHCPSGKSWGKPPPEGHGVWCQSDDGRTGPRTNWHENGTKSGEGWEIENEPAGPWKRWAENGQQIEEVYLIPPEGQTGWYRAWDATGKLLGEYEIVDGGGEARRWHDNGTVSERGPLVAGLRHGVWSAYTVEGKLRSTSTYASGLLHGKQEQFADDGKRIRESHFDSGEMHGVATAFDPDTGQIRRVDRHHHGRGGATTYYQDGEPLGVRPEDTGATACDDDESLSKALEAQGHPALPERRSCVSRSRSFTGVIQLGSFAHDRGCRSTKVVLDCKVLDGDLDSKVVLERAGWKRANADNRKAIAERYLHEIATTHSGSITSDPEPMQIDARSDGSVVIKAWKARPSGMRRGRTVDLMRYQFSAKGAFSKQLLETREER